MYGFYRCVMKFLQFFVFGSVSILSVCAFGMKKEEDFLELLKKTSQVSKKISPILHLVESLETESAYYEDRKDYLQSLQKKYAQLLKSNSEQEALQIIIKKIRSEETVTNTEQLNNFLQSSLDVCAKNIEGLSMFRILVRESFAESTSYNQKLYGIFKMLYDREKNYLFTRLSNRLKRKRQFELNEKFKDINSQIQEATKQNDEKTRTILIKKLKNEGLLLQYMEMLKLNETWYPPTYPEYLQNTTENIDKINVRFTIESYRRRLSFLKKFYSHVKEKIKDPSILIFINLHKNLRDILEGTSQDLGHPDQGIKTIPTKEHLKKAIEYQKKYNNEKILIYFERDHAIQEGEILFKDNCRIRIDVNSLTLSNIDNVIKQIQYFCPEIEKEKFVEIKKYIEKKKITLSERLQEIKKLEKVKETKNLQEKEVEHNKQKGEENEYQKTKDKNRKENPLLKEDSCKKKYNKNNEQKQNEWQQTPKKEKDHERRREEYEKKLKEEEKLNEKKRENKNSKEELEELNDKKEEEPFPLLSKDTKITLSTIFNHNQRLHWNEFVKAWKELREVMDGVKGAEPENVDGSDRKFHGGDLQEGTKKKKYRSFNLHEPHPSDGHMIGKRTLARVAGHFEEKFGWTLEKLEQHGFVLD